MKWIGIIAAAAYIGTVWAANYAVSHWGIVGVGFGLSAPAGVYFVGLAFTLRDIVHRVYGRYVVIGAIIAGALLSYWLGAGATIPGGKVSLALASGLAFLFSETADLSVYEPLRKRGWLPAVAASNVVGLVIDSALFLWLAFGSLALFWGQCIGKAWMTVLAIAVLYALRKIPARKLALA